MAEHYLEAKMPKRVIEKDPVSFHLWINSKKAGKLYLSQGRLVWQKGRGRGRSKSWEQFIEFMKG